MRSLDLLILVRSYASLHTVPVLSRIVTALCAVGQAPLGYPPLPLFLLLPLCLLQPHIAPCVQKVFPCVI